MLKYKRIILIIFAVLFLVILFLIKNTSLFKNIVEIKQEDTTKDGLTAENITIEDLVNRDTDSDGIPDWQEGLYGLDPTKKETTPGTLDSVAISKLRGQQENSTTTGGGGDASAPTENLTQTEKFSRELFATVAASNQTGAMDQTAVEALSASLAEKIQNPIVRKTFLISDIKIINDDSSKSFTNYITALGAIHKKYPTMKYSALDVLQEFSKDENSPNIGALAKLDPIIVQTNKTIDAMAKMDVPNSISTLHLNVINSLERLSENLSDIKLFETDPIVCFGAISKFNQNANTLLLDIANLKKIIEQKLNN